MRDDGGNQGFLGCDDGIDRGGVALDPEWVLSALEVK